MKSVFTFFSILLISGLVLSMAPPAKKFKYKSEEGRMSVTFPGTFAEESSNTPESITHKISTTVDEQIYFASYTLHSTSLDGADNLDEVSLESFVETIGGTVKRQSAWIVKGMKGIQATIDAPEVGSVMQYAVVLKGQLQYQLVVIAPVEDWNPEAANAFIDSFKIK